MKVWQLGRKDPPPNHDARSVQWHEVVGQACALSGRVLVVQFRGIFGHGKPESAAGVG